MKKENKIRNYTDKFSQHEHRPDIAGEHPQGDFFQGVFFIIFIAAIIIDRLTVRTHLWLSSYFPLWLRIGFAVLIFWAAWRTAMDGLKIVFGDIREKPYVLDTGVFSRVRHPVYLGAILMYAAGIVLSLSFPAFIVWMVIILYYHFLARYEEKLLIQKFGEEYRDYMKRVPMWLPRPVSSKRN